MNKLVFGQPIPHEMLAATGLYLPSRGPSGTKVRRSYAMKANPNPCLLMYGAGPDGVICKRCVHLFRQGGNKTFCKCKLRGKATHGPATDHYANWPACGKYEEVKK